MGAASSTEGKWHMTQDEGKEMLSRPLTGAGSHPSLTPAPRDSSNRRATAQVGRGDRDRRWGGTETGRDGDEETEGGERKGAHGGV